MDFEVRRDNFAECRFTEDSGGDIGPGQAVLKVAKFAFTANNVTYAVAGDMIGYWNFFPAEEGWGRIPVWGIGVVQQSTHPGIAEGDRYFGYFPMSATMTVEAEKVSPMGFVDNTPHRRALPPTYNQYTRMCAETGFDPQYDDYYMIFRPLFMTGFIIDDFLEDNDFYGAKRVVVSSASSKTSYSLAYMLAQREDVETIGLTSAGNKAFVEGLGWYDSVLTYDEIDSLANDAPAVLVDMAGNRDVIMGVHKRLGDQLKYSCLVGLTHWENGGPAEGLAGPEPIFFFAPDQFVKRAKDWGPEGLAERTGTAFRAFLEPVSQWLDVVQGEGEDAVKQVYLDTLQGTARADAGYILSL